MRLRTRFNTKDREHPLEERANVLASNLWRIACNGVLNLENEGFQTDTQSQRMDVVMEFAAFLLHCADRIAYTRLNDAERTRFMTAAATNLIGILADNLADVSGEGDHRAAVVARLNERMGEYAGFAFDLEEGPGFGFRRCFGDSVTDVMGPRDRKWITDQVMDIEVPEAMEALRRALDALLPRKPIRLGT